MGEGVIVGLQTEAAKIRVPHTAHVSTVRPLGLIAGSGRLWKTSSMTFQEIINQLAAGVDALPEVFSTLTADLAQAQKDRDVALADNLSALGRIAALEASGVVTDAFLARARLVVGMDKPGPDNTGVITGISRTNWNDPKTSGAVALPPGIYENKEFFGDLFPADPTGKYLLRNCKGHGGIGHPSNNRGSFFTYGLTSGWMTFEDCTITADDPSWYRDGIVGHRYTVRRCNVYGTNDGIGGNKPDGGIIEQNWIHDQVWWRNDPAHTDGSHNDPIQLQGGGPWIVRGNTLQAYVTADPRSVGTANPYPVSGKPGKFYGGSAIMLSEAIPSLRATISDNWLEGGYAQINVNNNRGASGAINVALGDNWFGRDVRNNSKSGTDKRWICLAPTGGTITMDGLFTRQRWDDNKTLLTAGNTTGIRTV